MTRKSTIGVLGALLGLYGASQANAALSARANKRSFPGAGKGDRSRLQLRRSLQRVPRISIHRPTASDAQASAESGSHFRHGKATFNLSPLCILWSDGHDLCERWTTLVQS